MKKLTIVKTMTSWGSASILPIIGRISWSGDASVGKWREARLTSLTTIKAITVKINWAIIIQTIKLPGEIHLSGVSPLK